MRIRRTLIALVLILALNVSAFSQGAGMIGQGKYQSFTDTGAVNANGWVCTYISNTTTPQNTYTDYTGTVTKLVPWQLDAAGRGEVWLLSGKTYRVAIYRAGTGNTCNGQAVGSLLWQSDGISALPASISDIQFRGSIQLSAFAKVAWGTSFGVPYITATSTTLDLHGGSGGILLTSASGSTTNLSISDAGTASLTGPLYLGSNGGTTGLLNLSSAATGIATIKYTNAGDYNFNLPSSAGTYGQPLLSGGGGSTSMLWAAAYFVASDFTTAANTNLQTITGLTWTNPASTAMTQPFRCYLNYSQATAAVPIAFGVQSATVSPTSWQVQGSIATSTTAQTYGNVTITNTTATNVISATPSATATVFNAVLSGLMEYPSSGSTSAINVMVSTSNAADLVTIKRGSYCRVF